MLMSPSVKSTEQLTLRPPLTVSTQPWTAIWHVYVDFGQYEAPVGEQALRLAVRLVKRR